MLWFRHVLGLRARCASTAAVQWHGSSAAAPLPEMCVRRQAAAQHPQRFREEAHSCLMVRHLLNADHALGDMMAVVVQPMAVVAARYCFVSWSEVRRESSYSSRLETMPTGPSLDAGLTRGGAGGGVPELHRCTVKVKVIALLMADVMTAVRKTSRLERRVTRAIGHA